MKSRRPRSRGLTSTGKKAVSWPSAGVSWSFALPGTQFNYEREAKGGLNSSVLVPVLCWLMRNVPEAPVIVEQFQSASDQWEVDEAHALPALIERPNPFYTGRTLLMATVMDYAFGEAFWIKNRNGMGELAELYWAPTALMEPKLRVPGDIATLYYNYTAPGGKEYEPKDVVHFRFGMDPKNPLRGFSLLHSMFREIYIDDKAANMAASVLRNLGIIGMVFSPKAGQPAIQPGKLEEFKKYYQENFTGDKSGQALAFSHPMDVQMLSYNLQSFDLAPMRDVSEERVTSVLGVPAAVVGFGTGLQQTKVGATMEQMIQLAWRQAVMPMQRDFAAELRRSLLPEFQKQLDSFRVLFDTSKVFALWEDVAARHERVRKDFAGRVIMLAEARRELGLSVGPEHEVWAQPSTMTIINQQGEVVGPVGRTGTVIGQEPATPAATPAETAVDEAANAET